jgi:HPt (histidine-containing phosphotransfer) domain-containing protein
MLPFLVPSRALIQFSAHHLFLLQAKHKTDSLACASSISKALIILQAKVLDTEVLLNVAPDLADRCDILKDFISETRSDVAELEDALKADDFPESVRLAHSIKGACSMVGAQELAHTCATIERLGRQCVPQAASSVRAAFDRLAAHLDAAFKERGPRWF